MNSHYHSVYFKHKYTILQQLLCLINNAQTFSHDDYSKSNPKKLGKMPKTKTQNPSHTPNHNKKKLQFVSDLAPTEIKLTAIRVYFNIL